MSVLMMNFRGVDISSPRGIEHVETVCGKYDLTDMVVGDVYDDLLRIVREMEADAVESDFYCEGV